jgi:hypothetical protein
MSPPAAGVWVDNNKRNTHTHADMLKFGEPLLWSCGPGVKSNEHEEAFTERFIYHFIYCSRG